MTQEPKSPVRSAPGFESAPGMRAREVRTRRYQIHTKVNTTIIMTEADGPKTPTKLNVGARWELDPRGIQQQRRYSV